MAKKYYAVKVGKSVGIYNNWEDCKKQVTGFSGAIYKSFPTLLEYKIDFTDMFFNIVFEFICLIASIRFFVKSMS